MMKHSFECNLFRVVTSLLFSCELLMSLESLLLQFYANVSFAYTVSAFPFNFCSWLRSRIGAGSVPGQM